MHTNAHPEVAERSSVKTVKTYPGNEVLRQKLIAARENGLSNNKLATKLGCSSSVISQWLSDDGNIYPGDISKWEKRAQDFLQNEARRRASGVETTACDVSRQMNNALEVIRRTNDVGIIMAAPGYGKTRAIEVYIKENPTAILFTVKSWCSDKGSIEGALFEAVGSGGYNGNQKRALFLTDKLTGSDRLLIVDDSHKLTRPALQWLFDFTDETQTPLGLIGTFDLEDKIADDAQRFSRVGLRYEIVPKEPRELIKHLIRTHAPDISDGAFSQLVDLCEQVAAEHGHYRAVNKQLKLSAELQANNGSAWPAAFREAHTQLVRKYKLN